MSIHTPRPLQLASAPDDDAFSSPSPPSSFRHPKRYSMLAATTPSPHTTDSRTTGQTKATRRKSSIAYFPPDSADSLHRGALARRNSLGALGDGLETTGPAGSWTGPESSTGTLSLADVTAHGVGSSPEPPVRDRAPLTLTEKHADLLRFIAQKESKCLELRSQLATHEAELVELKRKWQRIVNRGLERGNESVSGDGGSIVFDGIKEGVQGMSRLLTAGFSSYTPSPPSFSPRPTFKTPPPSLTHKSHSAKESESSISTYATSWSGKTGRCSQSSMSSFGEELGGNLEAEQCRYLGEAGEQESNLGNSDPNAHILMRQKQKQRLMDNRLSASLSSVRPNANAAHTAPATQTIIKTDFEGQTWSSDVQSTTAKVHRRKSHDAPRLNFEHLDFSTLSPSVLLSLPSTLHSNSTSPGASPRPGNSPSSSYYPNSGNGLKSNSTSSLGILAPMSSIPGLGLAAGATVSSPPVSSWMDSMGKKLGQFQKSPTFMKNQKRASLLLSDMSNSIVNVLAPPSTSSDTPGTPDTNRPNTSLKPPASPSSPNPSSSGMLLDDEDEDGTAKLGTAAVLQPVAYSWPTSVVKEVGTKTKEEGGSEDEEWGW